VASRTWSMCGYSKYEYQVRRAPKSTRASKPPYAIDWQKHPGSMCVLVDGSKELSLVGGLTRSNQDTLCKGAESVHGHQGFLADSLIKLPATCSSAPSKTWPMPSRVWQYRSINKSSSQSHLCTITHRPGCDGSGKSKVHQTPHPPCSALCSCIYH
jgi:hypothetical protein